MRVSEEVKAAGCIVGVWSVLVAAIWIVCPIMAQELSPYRDVPVPVEGKKNRDKHKHVEPVTPAPAPDIEPTPDPEFTNVMPDPFEKPRPKRPDRVEPDRRPVVPVAPAKPVVIYRGGWSSWFGGVFVGIVLGLATSWIASVVNLGSLVRRLLGK